MLDSAIHGLRNEHPPRRACKRYGAENRSNRQAFKRRAKRHSPFDRHVDSPGWGAQRWGRSDCIGAAALQASRCLQAEEPAQGVHAHQSECEATP